MRAVMHECVQVCLPLYMCGGQQSVLSFHPGFGDWNLVGLAFAQPPLPTEPVNWPMFLLRQLLVQPKVALNLLCSQG